MSIYHLFLVLLVVVIWGCNFIFVKFSLDIMSPLWLCTVRFFLASVPAIFFIKPPAASFKLVVLYALLMFILQFSFVFVGLYLGMPPGLASLLIQVQVFFSLFFAALFLKEIPTVWQVTGALVSFTGIGFIAMHLGGSMPLVGFLLVISAAAVWGLGNLVAKKISHVNMISLVVWGSAISCIPLLIFSLIFEGMDSLVYSYHHLSGLTIFSILYIVYASTWVGYGIWNGLIGRYSVSMVTPFTLLIPVVGILSSVLVLHEEFQSWKLISCLLVITGLCVNLLGARWFVKKELKEPVASPVE